MELTATPGSGPSRLRRGDPSVTHEDEEALSIDGLGEKERRKRTNHNEGDGEVLRMTILGGTIPDGEVSLLPHDPGDKADVS
jgi:hypothetical protein